MIINPNGNAKHSQSNYPSSRVRWAHAVFRIYASPVVVALATSAFDHRLPDAPPMAYGALVNPFIKRVEGSQLKINPSHSIRNFTRFNKLLQENLQTCVQSEGCHLRNVIFVI
uniref:Uncharacterized protein n=1 Tax=Sipha flava TaxID=143950 RepID=A0A2S2QA47_9HEMI